MNHSDSHYGELLDESTVRFQRLLPGPIERAWTYFVDSAKRSKWLCAGETSQEPGGLVEMHFHNALLSIESDIEPPASYRDTSGPVSFQGRVSRCDPPRYLSYTWDLDDEHSEVTYELAELGDNVRLVLTHTRLGSADEVTSACAGWHTHLAILAALMKNEQPPAFWKTHLAAATDYRRRFFA